MRARAAIAVAASIAAALFLAGVAEAHPAHTPSWRAEAVPFRLVFLGSKGPLVAEAPAAAPGPGGRLAYQLADGSRHHLTRLQSRRPIAHGVAYRVATDEPGRHATVAVERTPEGLRVRWSFQPSGDIAIVYEALGSGADEHYLGGGSQDLSVDLRGQITALRPAKQGRHNDRYCNNQQQIPSPFYLSSADYGFYAETSNVGRYAFPGAVEQPSDPDCLRTSAEPVQPPPVPCPLASGLDKVQICIKDDHLTYDIYAGDPAEVTTAYYRTVGMPSLPPPSQFAVMKWRDVHQNEGEVLEDVARFKQLRIPLGTVWIDNPWELSNVPLGQHKNGSACNGTLQFDPQAFPDPEGMIDAIHAQGVKFGLWVAPFVSTAVAGKPCPPPDYPPGSFLDVPGSANLWIDFTNPAARARFVTKLERVFGLGVDMVKGDRGDEWDYEQIPFAAGPGVTYFNRYPVLYQRAVAEALRAVNGDDFETLFRAGFTGTASATHGIWASDAWQTWEGFRAQVRFGLSESLTGHFAWGSDIGGIDPFTGSDATDSPSPALFVRWAQFGAVSPVYEVGGAGLNATPWKYNADTVRRFRDTAVLHTELFPYLYAQARRAARTGVPILRPVGYDFPRDARAWANDQEMMVGPDLLAAAVSADRAEADGEAGRPTPVDVYLPPGRWIDAFDGEVLTGGRHVVRSTNLDEFPLYVRAGSALGLNLRAPDVWREPWRVDDLDRRDRAGWVYAPARHRHVVASNPYGGRLEAHGRHMRLTGAPRETQLVLLTRTSPRRLRIDGRAAKPAASPEALRSSRTGWVTFDGPFQGVIVKLAPRAGGARVDFAR